jgi:hypothetical protein
MTIFEILNLRSQWEELAQTLNVEADSTFLACSTLLRIVIRAIASKSSGPRLCILPRRSWQSMCANQ